MSIKAVAFDIDGTLYPDASLRIRALPFGIRHLRLMATMAEVRKELHARSAAPRIHGACTDLDSFRELQARLAGQRLGLDTMEAKALIERLIYGELEAHFERVPLFPGVKDCLAALSDAGLALAVLSDFPVEGKLRALGIDGWFKVRRTSEECGLLKPAPEPFLALAQELGRDPAEVLYVGNSRSYDIAGARAAGMPAALRTARPGAALSGRVRHGHGGAAAKPDFAFRRFSELKDWVLTRTTTRR